MRVRAGRVSGAGRGGGGVLRPLPEAQNCPARVPGRPHSSWLQRPGQRCGPGSHGPRRGEGAALPVGRGCTGRPAPVSRVGACDYAARSGSGAQSRLGRAEGRELETRRGLASVPTPTIQQSSPECGCPSGQGLCGGEQVEKAAFRNFPPELGGRNSWELPPLQFICKALSQVIERMRNTA